MRDRTVLPWESYHRALEAAKISRGRFFMSLLSRARKHLKQQFCGRARKWRIQVCPQCC